MATDIARYFFDTTSSTSSSVWSTIARGRIYSPLEFWPTNIKKLEDPFIENSEVEEVEKEKDENMIFDPENLVL